MSSVLEKSLAIIELLVDHPTGLSVSAIAAATEQPVSGVHRTLQELSRLGYVRQAQVQGNYAMTIKLPAMGLGFLGRAGITDVAQPVLDALAADSGELIRLSVIDGDRLIWVAVAQGATRGLRYDPGQEQGVVVHLASSAGGKAWLSTMSDEEALAKVSAQGLLRRAEGGGANAPRSLTLLLEQLAEARARAYATAVDSYIAGMAAMAVPVRYHGNGPVLGCLSIAGPAVRMTAERMADLAPRLQSAAVELGEAAVGSQYFQAIMKALDPVSAQDRRPA
ncbi:MULTISPECIES: IclR family transcriptional regulator [Alphaproteobacteria]|uniref:Transcriptional regulator n=2 Tax=Alphaproteobacteria TaxID=28211 RepID=A0A512HH94_9HYPH|nr:MULTISPECIES: IclR family transcriptional regulator [Alphaproteobacteria]GEO84819.1 transcriptional regulator [Ciceribacter naphthalenivorans]GLR20560.1 transcriptional regulator [Ciceribacter naphthalenivorans]GLT03416.1 transcriptional regulator [Sphingomonas psychrolutea]